MAASLPNPSMVFVPLDILTAEEQNQLVANINYLAGLFPLDGTNIANGAIGTNQLASNAVKSQNIDWTTFVNGANYIDLGTKRIQWGIATGVNWHTATTVTFPAVFANTNYTFVATPQFNESGSSFWFDFILTKATGSVSIKGGCVKTDQFGVVQDSSLMANWIAIGSKP